MVIRLLKFITTFNFLSLILWARGYFQLEWEFAHSSFDQSLGPNAPHSRAQNEGSEQ
jgi:hypothetical protein